MKALNDPKQVVIIKASNLIPGASVYNTYVESLERGVNFILKSKFAPVKIVNSVGEAGDLKDVDILIFVSLSMRVKAQKIQKEYPHLRILIAASSLPLEEVVVLKKEWVTPEFIDEFSQY